MTLKLNNAQQRLTVHLNKWGVKGPLMEALVHTVTLCVQNECHMLHKGFTDIGLERKRIRLTSYTTQQQIG